MLRDINVNELAELQKTVFIDVRSEKEYQEGTIPGAVNIPLFDNEERARIGTVYTQESPKKAMELGLEIAGSKLSALYQQVEKAASQNPVTLFCWRGGMRSKSFAAVLDLMGLSVFRLSGGYKAYRRYLVDFFQREFPFHVVVLRGNTGTGKTDLLKRLKAEGYPVIDLEGLSNNRGSVFGSVGLGSQPSQKQFEASLFTELSRYQDHAYLVVECESKRIGKVNLPDSLYQAMQEGSQVLAYDTLESRSQRLAAEYTVNVDMLSELKDALERLKKRLGKSNLAELYRMLDCGEYEEFARKLIVEYYDLLYGYPNEESDNFDFCIFNNSLEHTVQKFKEYLDLHFESLKR